MLINTKLAFDFLHHSLFLFKYQIDGSTPSACWKEIYSRIRNKQCNEISEVDGNVLQKSGSYMFGFSSPQIAQLIQVCQIFFLIQHLFRFVMMLILFLSISFQLTFELRCVRYSF